MDSPTATSWDTSPADRLAEQWRQTGEPPDLHRYLNACGKLPPRELADVLLVDQSHRWRAGEAPGAERYLAEWPDVAGNPQLRLDLVYGEMRARRMRGEPADLESFARRFPDLADALSRQVEVGEWLAETHFGWFDTYVGSLSDPPADQTTETAAAPLARHEAFDPRAPLPWSDFELQEKLGAGSMGEVYRARQISLNKPVAVKLLRIAISPNPELVERFLREARTMANLGHPHIVDVHGIGRCPNGGYFLVMDLIEGVSLADRVAERPLPIKEAIQIVADVAEAVGHANRRGVIHRDLKPSNILLDGQGRVLVTDFGLAKLLTDESAFSMGGQIIGTPPYMAPEQADPQRGAIGPPTDVYGLGALLFALLTGQPPLHGGNTVQLITRLISDESPPTVSTLRSDVPDALSDVCAKCLSKNPADRFPTCHAVLEALTPLVTRAPAVAAEPAPAGGTAPPITATVTSEGEPRHGWPWRWAVAVAVLVLMTFMAWRLWSPPSRTAPAISQGTDAVPAAAIEVNWKIDIFREGRPDRRVSLLNSPGPLLTGDAIRLELSFSRPAHAYLFWIGSDGTVEALHPESGPTGGLVAGVAVPEAAGLALPIRGPEGTEVCVLVLRESPAPAELDLVAALRPAEPLPPLEAETVLLNGVPLTAGAGAGQGISATTLLERLPADVGSRNVGPAQPLARAPFAESFGRWYRGLAPEIGTVHYLAIPHLK